MGVLTILEDEKFEIQDFSNISFDLNMEMLDQIFDKAMSAENLKKITLNDSQSFEFPNALDTFGNDLEWQPWDNNNALDIEYPRAYASDMSEDSLLRRESLASVEMARDASGLVDVPFSPSSNLKQIDSESERRKSLMLDNQDTNILQSAEDEANHGGFSGFDDIPFEPMEFDAPL